MKGQKLKYGNIILLSNLFKIMTFEELQESYANLHGYESWHEIEEAKKTDVHCIGFAKFCLVQNLLERDENKEQIDALCKKAGIFDGLVKRIESELLTDRYGNHIGHAFDWLSSENSEAIAVILENFYNNDAAL